MLGHERHEGSDDLDDRAPPDDDHSVSSNRLQPQHDRRRYRESHDNGSSTAFFVAFALATVVLSTCLGMLLQWRVEERQAALDADALPRPEWMGPYIMATRSGRRYRDVQATARVSLTDLWRGASMDATYDVETKCSTCGGAGGSGRRACPYCQGSGVRTIVHRGLGMMQRSQCSACEGKGFTVQHTCDECGGHGHVESQRHATFHLSPGLAGGDVIRVVGAGHAHGDDREPGDLAVTLVETPERHLAHLRRCTDAIPACVERHKADGGRVGNDGGLVGKHSPHLYTELTVSLREALLGFERHLAHPSGEDAVASAPAGRITQPGTVIGLSGKGLPRRTTWFAARTLYIQGSSGMSELQQEDEWAAAEAESAATGRHLDSVAKYIAATGNDGGVFGERPTPTLPLLGLGDIKLPTEVCSIPFVGQALGCVANDAGNGLAYGDLLVEVNVAFPDELTGAQEEAAGIL